MFSALTFRAAKLLFLAGFLFVALSSFVNAQDKSYVFEEVNVDIEILEDSRFLVEEEIVYRFDGVYRGVFREVATISQANLDRCRQDASLQCGGFDEIKILDLIDNDGNSVPLADYTIRTVFNEEANESRVQVRWAFSEDGIDFDNETFAIKLKYEIIGGVGFFDDYALFYWNALFPDRDVVIEKSEINISYPAPYTQSLEDVNVLRSFGSGEVIEFRNGNLNVSAEEIVPSDDFTIIQKIPKDIFIEPATITFTKHWIHGFVATDPRIFIDGNRKFVNFSYDSDIGEQSGQLLNVLPSSNELTIEQGGYFTQRQTLDLNSGDNLDVEIYLTPNPIMGVVLMVVGLVNLLGLILMPFAVIYPIMRYRKRGVDPGNKTVVPQFYPPKIIDYRHAKEEVAPYLLGSLFDESVDNVDISVMIVTLAIRGYIKIKEIKPKYKIWGGVDYEFIKLKSFDDLRPTYQVFGEALFHQNKSISIASLMLEKIEQSKVWVDDPNYKDKKKKMKESAFYKTLEELAEAAAKSEVPEDESGQDSVKSNKLTYKFADKIRILKQEIYKELVEEGLFEKNPDTVRNSYYGVGIAMVVIGLVVGTFLSVFIMDVTNSVFGVYFVQIAVVIYGITTLIFANKMPKKTENGARILREAKGFEMFLHHAERFKLQNLTPAKFEAYLPFAMVFGVEKQWGKNFENIYSQNPSWYEGATPNSTFNSVVFANSISRLSGITNTAMAQSAPSSSSSGGGFGGGGGFSGGFSGGGGGGGGGGAF